MLLQNKIALSPVIASIILIAVVVAVSIAAVTWMGSISLSFMKVDELTVSSHTWALDNSYIDLTLKNLGTTTITISDVTVNDEPATSVTYPFSENATLSAGDTLTVRVTYNFVSSMKYEFTIITTSATKCMYIAKANPHLVGTQWLSGWNFRKAHIIDGSASTAGTEYQIRLIAHYGTGADNGENVYLGNKAKTDFGDLRFVQSDNQALLSYWLESKIDGETATFWVKIAGNLTAQSQIIYVYYGNNQATIESNGETTFVFFDDFSSDLSKWVKEKNGAHIYINSGYLVLDGGTTSSPYGHTVLGSSVNYSVFLDGVIEADVFPSNNALPEIGFRGVYSGNIGYKVRWDCRSGSESPWMKPAYDGWNAFGSSITRCGLSNQWQKVKIEVIGSTFKMYSNDVLKSTVVDGQYGNDGEISLQNHYGTSSFYDNVRIRKYVNFEPIQSVWGVEESYS
jgi:hypothetical protein